MRVTYKPDGQAPRSWLFRPGRVRASECEIIEKRWRGHGSPETYDGWAAAIIQGSARAERILLWHLLRLELHTLRLEDVDPYKDELLIEFSSDEVLRIQEAVTAHKPKNQAEEIERSEKLKELEALYAQTMAEEEAAGIFPTTAPQGA
jgi:hypothetical protein